MPRPPTATPTPRRTGTAPPSRPPRAACGGRASARGCRTRTPAPAAWRRRPAPSAATSSAILPREGACELVQAPRTITPSDREGAPTNPRSDRGAPARVLAQPPRDRRERDDRVVRAAGRTGGGQRRQGAQRPLLPGL